MRTLKPDPKVLAFLEKIKREGIDLPEWKRGILEESAKAFRDEPRPEIKIESEKDALKGCDVSFEDQLASEVKK